VPVYVIDASVIVADARPQESSHADARAILEHVAAGGAITVLPTIVLAETAAAISRGTGRPTLARRLIAAMVRVPHYQFVAVDADLGRRAAALAADHCIRGCDSVYVALAQREGATLITLDRQQLTRAPSSVTVHTPAQELDKLRR